MSKRKADLDENRTVDAATVVIPQSRPKKPKSLVAGLPVRRSRRGRTEQDSDSVVSTISSLGIVLITQDDSRVQRRQNMFQICDPILNNIIGDIKTEFHLYEFCLIPKHGLLLTSHYEKRGYHLILWNMGSGLGERVEVTEDGKGLKDAKIAVDHANTKFINGPHIIDIESRQKIGTLGGWLDGYRFVDISFSHDDKYLVGFSGYALYTWDMQSNTMIGTVTATESASRYWIKVSLGTCSHLYAHQTNKTVYVWDLAAQALKFTIEGQDELPCFSPDDTTLVSLVNVDKLASTYAVSIVDVATGLLQRTIQLSRFILTFRDFNISNFNPMNGKFLASFDRDDECLTMVEIDLATEEVVRTKTKFSGIVKNVFVLPPLAILM